MKKKLSTFIPLNRKGVNCLEACLLSLTLHYYNEYQAVLLKCFNFSFAEKPVSDIDTVGNHFNQNPSQILYFLKEFYNVEIIKCDLKNINEKFNFVCKSVEENEAILLMISTYYCNWLKSYQTAHQQHFIIILGKTNHESFICSDPMLMGSNLSEMTFHDFFRGCQQIYIVGRLNTPPIYNLDSLISLTRTHLEKLELERSFNLFIDKLINTCSLENEYNESKSVVWTSLLDMNVGYFLTGSHQLYADFLAFLASLKFCFQSLSEDAEKSLQISKKWYYLKNLFYKCYLKNSFCIDKMKIINVIYDIKNMSIHLKNGILKKTK